MILPSQLKINDAITFLDDHGVRHSGKIVSPLTVVSGNGVIYGLSDKYAVEFDIRMLESPKPPEPLLPSRLPTGRTIQFTAMPMGEAIITTATVVSHEPPGGCEVRRNDNGRNMLLRDIDAAALEIRLLPILPSELRGGDQIIADVEGQRVYGTIVGNAGVAIDDPTASYTQMFDPSGRIYQLADRTAHQYDIKVIARADAKPIGRKETQGKLRWSLLPWDAIEQIVRVLEAGAVKYSVDNWRSVANWRQLYFDAAHRHITAWWGGQRCDPESGLHHLAHAGCDLLFLLALDKETA